MTPPCSEPPEMKRVAVTGASGTIGMYFAEQACTIHELVLIVHKEDERSEKLKRYGRVVACDLSDLEGLQKAFEGADVVLHLAADPSPSAMWESLLNSNIIGTYNTFLAAKNAGCKKLVYASSIHAVSGYPPDVQIKPSDPVNPGDLYGVTKCFGEALARYMAGYEDLPCLVLRIGAFQPAEKARTEEDFWMMDAFLSRKDLSELILAGINDKRLRFAILHALSDNRFKRLDITEAREFLGYSPKDDFTRENHELQNLHLEQRVHAHNAGDPGAQSGIRGETEQN